MEKVDKSLKIYLFIIRIISIIFILKESLQLIFLFNMLMIMQQKKNVKMFTKEFKSKD